MITLVEVESYDLTWRLDPAAEGVRNRTTLRFRGEPGPVEVCGDLLAPPRREPGALRVEALLPYTGLGFRRVTDPADGQVYLCTTTHPHGAPQVVPHFAGRPQRAPATVAAVVPASWKCLANGLPVVAEGEVRTFAPTAPVSPAWLSVAAGPFVEVAGAVHVPRSAAGTPVADRVADLVARAIAFFSDLLVSHPYPKCELVFVPGLRSLALSTQGLVLVDLGALERFADPRHAVTAIGHEVAHAWSGNLVDGDPWLVEGLAVYLSRLFAETEFPGGVWDDPPPPDRPYRPHLDRVLAVEARIGRDALLRGLRAVFTDFAHGHAAAAEFEARWAA
ncbi:M1 family aminopeptidase [Saccharothrix syringae]|uniref:Peptidase M1 membrane alanine aminopeptidase domain-containing protein n=1 Tax=Saccharothrix syringae TaxID=103733 RepID=A0A5Q0GS03_SACSY|nr:M1 family aminopeptidase [Saccharothrix syringae]QFZ16693.1 hypothetical protein EKG83_03755 [Saccharothrix syringae]